MTNSTINNGAAATQTIKLTQVIGLEGAESSSTLWTGRGKDRKDIKLSMPLPEINAISVIKLANEQSSVLADFINDSFQTYIRSVKCQRLTLGSTLELELPTDQDELANLILIALTEGSRQTKELTGSTIRDSLQAKETKAAIIAYCESTGISPAAFTKVVINEFLLPCTRQDYCIYKERAATAEKAVRHIAAISQLLSGQAARVLLLASQRIAAAPVVDADEMI